MGLLVLPCWHWEPVPAGLSFSLQFSPSVTVTITTTHHSFREDQLNKTLLCVSVLLLMKTKIEDMYFHTFHLYDKIKKIKKKPKPKTETIFFIIFSKASEQ